MTNLKYMMYLAVIAMGVVALPAQLPASTLTGGGVDLGGSTDPYGGGGTFTDGDGYNTDGPNGDFVTIAPVPEPGTYLLMGSTLLLVAVAAKRRKAEGLS